MPNHLIHIGYPKTASTFLQEWFERHPQLFFSKGLLGGFQNVHDICRQSPKMYDKAFKTNVTSHELFSFPIIEIGDLIFDVDNTYASKGKKFQAIQKTTSVILKNLFPNAKILIITRGFQSIIHSTYSQYIAIGGIKNFSEFCKIYENSINYNYIINLYYK